MSARWDRAAAAVAVVLGLLLVVGASARRPLNGGAAAPALPTWPLLFVVGVGLVVSTAIGLAVVGPLMRVRAGQSGRSALRAGPLTFSLSLLVPAAILALYSMHGHGLPNPVGPSQTSAGQDRLADEHDGRHADHTAGIAALTAGIAAGIIGFAGLALVRARRRRDPFAEPRATVAEGARDAAAAAAIPADPRAAVLAAYARMEAALASVGLARRPSDAPREYLARLETGLGGGRAPAARLTELFERARFSPHPVGEESRAEAIGALERLRMELEAPA
jgi:Domain of unknown function (DUF4129)